MYGSSSINPTTIETYDDHRMAMAFAVLGAKFNGITIEDPTVVTKSFPEFWDRISELGVTLS